MRRAIAIVLSAILVTTPIKVVLAQAGQQESQVTDIPSVVTPRTDQTPARIGVPVIEPGSGSALLFTVGMRDHTQARDALPLSPPYRRISTAGKVVPIVIAFLVALVVVVTLACAGPACD